MAWLAGVTAAVFPFGSLVTPRPPRRPEGLTQAFVLGVYPSALHVRWKLPGWFGEGTTRVEALAVRDEPVVFWDGLSPSAVSAVEAWKSEVGFQTGDEPDQWGHVEASGNGSSGRSVLEKVLRPLGVEPELAWFTDAVNHFFVKTGNKISRGQADVLRDLYNPFADLVGLRHASLPARPSPAVLVRIATTEHRDRLRRELQEAAPTRVLTLGEEARRVLLAIADAASGRPTEPITARRFSGVASREYGEAGTVEVGAIKAAWCALKHPGQRAPVWEAVHDDWAERWTPSG